MKLFKRLLAMLIFTFIVAMGVAFILRANIGVGPYDAVSYTMSYITNIKVGTIMMIINSIFVVVQIVLLRKKFKITQYFQFVVLILFGEVVNFFYYEVITFELSNYILRLLMFLLGTLIVSIGVAGVMNIDVVYTPLEGFISALSKKLNAHFVKYRLYFDIFCIVFTLIMVFLFKVQLVLREGTIISATMFSPLLGIFMKLEKQFFKKYNLVEEHKDDYIKEIEEIVESI